MWRPTSITRGYGRLVVGMHVAQGMSHWACCSRPLGSMRWWECGARSLGCIVPLHRHLQRTRRQVARAGERRERQLGHQVIVDAVELIRYLWAPGTRAGGMERRGRQAAAEEAGSDLGCLKWRG